jgi:[ribosomal protein S5]-alanine N-acetyltransferase
METTKSLARIAKLKPATYCFKNMQIEFIETPRLKGEKISVKHQGLLLEMSSNQLVMATLGGTWTPQETCKKIESNCEQWQCYGHGQWIFFDKATDLFVGRGGIRKVIVNDREEVELGYALMPEFWGRELAVEIGKKALSIAFNDFSYPSVVCYTLVENKRSERVMQKIGFFFEQEIIHANYPHVLYRYKNPALY